MRSHSIFSIVVFCGIQILGGCGSDSDVNDANKGNTGGAVQSDELQLMAPDDMNKLREERKEAIERSSPLNTESDPVEAMKKRFE